MVHSSAQNRREHYGNRTIKESTIKAYKYEGLEQLDGAGEPPRLTEQTLHQSSMRSNGLASVNDSYEA